MSKSANGRAGYIFRLVLNVLLLLEYLYLIYIVVSSFSFVPWYDPEGSIVIHYLFLWIPLGITTLVLVSAMFLSKTVYRPRVMLLCFNALVIPLTYLLELAGIGWLLTALKILCAVGVIAYFIIFFLAVKKKTV